MKTHFIPRNNKVIYILTIVLVLVGIITLLTSTIAQESSNKESKTERDARMKWWREARFGMFIHWGLYAVPAGTWNGKQIDGIGEWIMHNARIPVSDYARLTAQFNPEKFNADAWVTLAKNAGMKYIVITAKHHDGFAMFHTHASPYNIYDATPFHRDPLKELAAACKKQGIKLGFYYSEAQDWHHPGGATYDGHWDKAQDGNMDDYLKNIAYPQVKELLTNYGKVAVLWWDTPADMNKERANYLSSLLKLQPDIITNDRLGGDVPGDTQTPEQYIPPTGFPNRDWETCMTMNDTWGYKSYDNNFKSAKTLIRNLIDIASKGGNYLLNVGPTAEGLMPQPSIERLQEIGNWMKTNSEAIYGTTASPFKKLSFGRCTRKGQTLYLHVFTWPEDGKIVVPMTNKITQVYLLADPNEKLPFISTKDGQEIVLPTLAPDTVASVVVLKIIGEPNPIMINKILSQNPDGSIQLLAEDADLKGNTITVEGEKEFNIGYWSDVNDIAQWQIHVNKPGKFNVTIIYACDSSTPGTEYTLKAGNQSITGIVKATPGWQKYITESLGSLQIDKPGEVLFTVQPNRKPLMALMNLRKITLTPSRD